MPRAVRAVGRPGLVAGLFLAGTFFFFIGSLTRTTVANTFVLMSVSPFLAAIAGRLFLHEKVATRTWVAMAVAFAGIVVMFADSLDAGRLSGNLLALGVSCCFAAQVTVLRKYHAHVDMLPQVMIAGLISLLVALALAPPFAATARDLLILALMGCIQLGTGCLLATAASRVLSATELGLLALLRAHPRSAVGLGAHGRATGTRSAGGRRHRARRRDREPGIARLAPETRRRCGAVADARPVTWRCRRPRPRFCYDPTTRPVTTPP